MSAALRRGASSPSSTIILHRTVESMRSVRRGLDRSVTVGFVPTMGALHEGHLSLVRAARACHDVVVASIFVNPTQFGPGEDLDRYPRQLERDSELLADAGVDHLFCPDAATMYRPHHVTYVDPQGFDDTAEGRSRPGHFRGVATVVTKLFHIVEPTAAYFGQKDACQCAVIRRLVQDLDLDVDVQVLDTIREADGLALSSRNAYLTPAERRAAPIVYRALCAARELWQQQQQQQPTPILLLLRADELRAKVQQVLAQEPLIVEVLYVAVDCRDTMRPLDTLVPGNGAIVSVACKLGGVRLIDNIVLS